MDRAVNFYERSLGLTLRFRAQNFYAALDAGEGFIVALHPQEAKSPKPGTPGSTLITLAAAKPLDEIKTTLASRGVRFDGPIIDDDPVRLLNFKDPDGTPLCIVEMKPQRA
jgi:catechol 2,3-dioxygenase-like lactoylglutathione lyase family enzyme